MSNMVVILEWPAAAVIEYKGEKYPFTEINGVKIGTEDLQEELIDDHSNPRDEEAESIDNMFGYYVPLRILRKGDKATWDFIRSEIDDDFAAGDPE